MPLIFSFSDALCMHAFRSRWDCDGVALFFLLLLCPSYSAPLAASVPCTASPQVLFKDADVGPNRKRSRNALDRPVAEKNAYNGREKKKILLSYSRLPFTDAMFFSFSST